MGIDLEENRRLMGDSVIEQRLIQQQIQNQLNRNTIEHNLVDFNEQVKKLYDSAHAEYERLNTTGLQYSVPNA